MLCIVFIAEQVLSNEKLELFILRFELLPFATDLEKVTDVIEVL